MKKAFIVLVVVYLSLMVCAKKSDMELSLSSTLTGEPVIITVSDRDTGVPLEDVGVQVFWREVLPIESARVFWDFTDAEGKTEPFVIDEPGTYIVTLGKEGYYYREIRVVFYSPLPEYPGIWLPACLLFIPFIVFFFIRLRQRF